MAKLSNIFTSKSPNGSSATYKIMSHRSDGQIMEGKGPKPKTATDEKIHLGHIRDSSFYNLRHTFDHSDELAFDYSRLRKDLPADAKDLQAQTTRLLNPNFKKMGLKLSKVIS